MLEVPTIDVGPLLEDAASPAAAAVGEAIDAACREIGFFRVVGHGIDPALRERLDRLARAFFALDEQEKARIAMANGGRAWRGWFPVGGELTSGVPDLKEGLYFGSELGPDDPRVLAGRPLHGANQFPRDPAELGPTVLEYLDRLTTVGQAVLAGMALGLGLDPGYFAAKLTSDPVVLFRIFRYPPERASESAGDAAWGVGEHTDYGLLTLLGQDATGGLQVHAADGWLEVPADPDAFVCNLGDMLERLTGGAYRSTAHRVRNTSGVERLSFPFFLDPSWDAVVDRLPIVARPDETAAAERWDRTSVHGFAGTYGEYLVAKVQRVFPELAGAAITATASGGPPPS